MKTEGSLTCPEELVTGLWVTWIQNTSTNTHTHTHIHTHYLFKTHFIIIIIPKSTPESPSRICLFPHACHMLCPSNVLLLQGKCHGLFRFRLCNIGVRSGNLPKRMAKMTEQFLTTLLIWKTILMILGCHHAAGIATQRSIVPSSTESHQIWRMNPSQELLLFLDIANQHTACMYYNFFAVFLQRSRVSFVGKVTRLPAGLWNNRVSIIVVGKADPASYPVGVHGLFPCGQSTRGANWIAHLLLVQRLWVHEDIPSPRNMSAWSDTF